MMIMPARNMIVPQASRVLDEDSRRNGFHFYVDITPPVEAELANRLQWLLGDDCGGVDCNGAGIRSGLKEWNKPFERPNARLITIYRARFGDQGRGTAAYLRNEPVGSWALMVRLDGVQLVMLTGFQAIALDLGDDQS